MVFGPGENKLDGQQKKQPILLSFALIMDFLIIVFSVALIFLMSLNMPKQDLTESLEKMKFTGGTVQHITHVMVLSLFATFFAWITSMFGGIYSMTILFGKKYNWPCCPQLKNQIQKELLGSKKKRTKKKKVDLFKLLLSAERNRRFTQDYQN